LAKSKVTSLCKTENCESEKNEVEKGVDDQQLIASSLPLSRVKSTEILNTVFSYTANFENEIYKNLSSPPPEQA
jgi:hypothetical protein